MARAHARHEQAGFGPAGRDDLRQPGLRGGPKTAGRADGRRQHAGAAGGGVADTLGQHQRHRRRRAVVVVAVAAVGVQVAQRRAFAGRHGGQARQLHPQRLRQPAQPAALQQHVQVRAARLAAAGSCPADKLHGADAEHRRRRTLVAGQAVGARRHGIAAAGRLRHRQRRQAGGGCQHGVAAVFVPDVGGVAPAAIGTAFDVARLDAAAAVRDSFHSRVAGRKDPGIGARRVDEASRRQRQPALLDGAVGPQRYCGV